MARAAEDAGTDVLVEVPGEPLDHEADLRDRALQLHRGVGAPRPEREEDVTSAVVESVAARERKRRAAAMV